MIPQDARQSEDRLSFPLYHDVPLAWDHCVDLAERVREGDGLECRAMGNTPLQALSAGIMTGKARAALRPSSSRSSASPAGACIGAWGWTFHGTIWSLWAADMSPKEKLHLLRETPERVSAILKESSRDYLWNYIAANNPVGLAWLRASKSFWIEEEPRLIVSGEPFYYFQTRGLAALETLRADVQKRSAALPQAVALEEVL